MGVYGPGLPVEFRIAFQGDESYQAYYEYNLYELNKNCLE